MNAVTRHKLSASDLRRLTLISALFRSPEAGERACAAWRFSEILNARGLDLADVFEHLQRPEPEPEPRSWRDAVEAALRHPERLTAFERDFCRNILQQGWISPAQSEILAGQILPKLRRAGR